MVFRFNVIVVRFNVFQVAVSDFFRLTDKKQTQLRKGVVLKHSNCARARVRVCVCVCVCVRACVRASVRARARANSRVPVHLVHVWAKAPFALLQFHGRRGH